MDLAQILGQLWRHRLLLFISALVAIIVGISVAYTPSISPVGFHKRSLTLGAASTTLVVDTRQSATLDLAGSLDPLAARATSYANLASSDPVISLLGQQLHLKPGTIVADPGLTGQPQQQSALQRSSAVVSDLPVWRLSVTPVQDQPILNVATQAPSAAKATKLADQTGVALRRYTVQQQVAQHVPKTNRITIRQLGRARGGTVNSGANPTASVLGGLATFVALCLLILFSDRLRTDMRRKRMRSYDGAHATRNMSNGQGMREQVDPVSDAVADRRRARTSA